MLYRPLFKRYQQELTAFCNTKHGRTMLASCGAKEALENYSIIQVTPDGFTQVIDQEIKRSVFHPRSPFINIFREALTYLDIAQEYIDVPEKELIIPHFMGITRLLKNKLPTIYLTTSTFYPDPSVESTSVDGQADRRTVDEIWATIRAGAGTNADDSGVLLASINRSSATTDQFQRITRSFIFYDTSALPDTDTISAATLSLVVATGANLNALGNLVHNISSSDAASNTAIVASDFTVANFGGTQFSTGIATDSFVDTPTYNDFVLNASGIATISKTSISKFGFRTENDIDDSAPTWVSDVQTAVQPASADTADTTVDPKLVVIHSAKSGGGNPIFLSSGGVAIG